MASQPAADTQSTTAKSPIARNHCSCPISVEDGFVSTINRPGANVTGASTLNLALEPKRLDLLQKMIPAATAVGFLINPNSDSFDRVVRQFTEAARTLGCEMVVLGARTEEGVASAFTTVAQRRLRSGLPAGELLSCAKLSHGSWEPTAQLGFEARRSNELDA